MARTNIVAQAFVGSYPTLPIGTQAGISFTSNTDPTDRSTPLLDKKTVVLAWNTDSGAHDITFTSAVDVLNRTGDIVDSIPAGKIHAYGPFSNPGWQAGGLLLIDVADPKIELAVITLP